MPRSPASSPAALLPVLALLFNAFVWGSSWWPFRALQARGVHPLWGNVLVFSVAVLVIGLLRPRAFGEVLRAPALWLLALAAGATNAAFNWGIVIGDVVRVVLLFYLMPLWTVLLARWLLHEPFTRPAALRVVLGLAGAAIVLWPDGAATGWAALPLPRSGADVLGLVGGMTFALNNVLLRREAAQPEEARAMAMFLGGVGVAGALAAGLALGSHVAWPPVPAAGWVLIALALAAAFLSSNLALQFGAARLPANVTSVVLLSEVLFASATSVLWGEARLTAALLAGGGLIVAAALLSARASAPPAAA